MMWHIVLLAFLVLGRLEEARGLPPLVEGLLHRRRVVLRRHLLPPRHALGHGQVDALVVSLVAARTTGSRGAKRPPAAQALRAATVERRAGAVERHGLTCSEHAASCHCHEPERDARRKFGRGSRGRCWQCAPCSSSSRGKRGRRKAPAQTHRCLCVLCVCVCVLCVCVCVCMYMYVCTYMLRPN